jgi:hypothetical protein
MGTQLKRRPQNNPPLARVSAQNSTPDKSGNRVLYNTRYVGDIGQYAYHVPYFDAHGVYRRRTFFIGTDSTWTPSRERAAFAAAKKFAIAYEEWAHKGGVHPMDTGDHHWSAAEH